MNIRLPDARCRDGKGRLVLALIAAVLLSLSTATGGYAQKTFSQKYRVRGDARLEIKNRFGTITVEAWNRDEIKVTANMDTPAARFTPESDDDCVEINVVRENHGRADVGDVNFTIYVPVNSTVDVETRRGNITVRGVQGEMVRARVFSSGDIQLTEIGATKVMASNLTGDIFFDGEFDAGGDYNFKAGDGNINIRIPAHSAFRLEAAAPFTRSITLGAFANSSMNSYSDGRKVVGNVGDGRATLSVMNYRGRISFIRR